MEALFLIMSLSNEALICIQQSQKERERQKKQQKILAERSFHQLMYLRYLDLRILSLYIIDKISRQFLVLQVMAVFFGDTPPEAHTVIFQLLVGVHGDDSVYTPKRSIDTRKSVNRTNDSQTVSNPITVLVMICLTSMFK